LAAYDYAQPGAYFVTVVTHGRRPLFGAVRGEEMVANAAGRALWRVWSDLPKRFAGIEIDEFVVMPNHVHGLLWLIAPTAPSPQPDRGSVSLGDVVGAFKSIGAREANRILGRNGALWQRNYYERIVRNDAELNALRKYVVENPLRWSFDHENPDRLRR
jgi:REP element-mobilizing transposase RayT